MATALAISTIGAYPIGSLWPLNTVRASTPSAVVRAPALKDLSESQLKTVARAIAVKVRTGSNWGSGILIQRQGRVYTVVTNQHVLNLGDRYEIQTPDGRTYAAHVTKKTFGDRDLGLLQFRATANYAVASLGMASTLHVGDRVFAAGFPIESLRGSALVFTFTSGEISLLTSKALAGGYQIGYTNDVRKGMSGGPLLNRQGKVVGINGMHAYPVWGDPFVFTDGSHPNPSDRALMVRSSWAIPIETLVQKMQQS